LTQQLNLFSTDDLVEKLDVGRECKTCKNSLPLSDFSIRYKGHSGDLTKANLRASCKECDRAHNSLIRGWRGNNPLPEDFRCPLCLRNQEDFVATGRYSKQTPFVVDHCHVTMKVRGYLCNTCNVGLGSINDDPAILRRMLNYLEA